MFSSGGHFEKDNIDGYGEDQDLQFAIRTLRNQMNESLRHPSPVENLEALFGKTEVLGSMFSLQFRDQYGYTLLGNAMQLSLLPVIKFLVEKKKFLINEELIIAVELDFKEAVEYLITQEPGLINRPVLTGTIYRPGLSPVMVASLNENESMLKFLLTHGAHPLAIPNYNPREGRNIIRFDAIYQTILALSKPLYLCIMNEDPIMVALKISERCQQIASSLDVAQKDLLAVKKDCEKFATDFISNVSTFDDLQLILDQMTTEDENIVAPGEPWERLKYAMAHNHTEFVANGSVQKYLKKKFYEGPIALHDFESAHLAIQILYILSLVFLTPLWIFFYLFVPDSDSSTGKMIRNWMEMPIMRYVVQMTLYICLLIMVFSSTVHSIGFQLGEFESTARERVCLEELEHGRPACLSEIHRTTEEKVSYLNDSQNLETDIIDTVVEIFDATEVNGTYIYLIDAYIFMWTIGNTFKEFSIIWSDGFVAYNSDWVNCLNMQLNFYFFICLLVKYAFIIREGEFKPPRLGIHDELHPVHVSDTFRALGACFLILKMYKTLRITSAIGKPQHLMSAAFKASFNFLILFFCTLVAFSVSFNGLIHWTYFAFLKRCYLFQDSLTNVNCGWRLTDINLDEMETFQDLGKLWIGHFFAMFQSDTQIQLHFPEYINAQEWIATILNTIYAFVMIVVRLNILISLIIIAVLHASKRQVNVFKFHRAQLQFMFIAGSEPIPPPLNVIPGINRITSWQKKRKQMTKKMFSEDELKTVTKMRAQMQRLKGTYLRNYKLNNINRYVTKSDITNLKSGIVHQVEALTKNFSHVQHRLETIVALNSKRKRGNAGELEEAIESNKFLQRYKNKAVTKFTQKAQSFVNFKAKFS